MTTTQQPSPSTRLFMDYLSVCNEAIAENKNKFPYDKILEQSQKMLSDKSMGVAIYKDKPAAPHDFFTIKMSAGNFYVADHGKKAPDMVWKASEDYLRKVVSNKADYIAHPAKLDLDWLKSRIGLN